MKVIKIPLNPFTMNCYIYYDETSKEGIIIDPAAFSAQEENRIKKLIEDNGIKIKYIINTHGHLDHILGNKFAREYFNVPVYMHKDDFFMIENAPEQAAFFGFEVPAPPAIDEEINENTVLKINGIQLRFIHTPGHSPGSVCIIDDENKNVFCGDLVFKNSIGRTDLPGGDMDVLINSIKNKLFASVKDDYILYPGHMEITNVSDEKRMNPFL